MATDAKERMIRTAGRLLRQRGYHGTGLNLIVSESGAPKGSIYFHFPGGKAELVAAAIDGYAESVGRILEELVEDRGTAAEGLAAYLDRVEEGFSRVGFAEGCAVATASAEVAPLEPLVGAATRRALDGWVDALATRLVAEGRDREQAHGLAVVAITIIEGAIVMAKGLQSVAPLGDARAALRTLLTVP